MKKLILFLSPTIIFQDTLDTQRQAITTRIKLSDQP